MDRAARDMGSGRALEKRYKETSTKRYKHKKSHMKLQKDVTIMNKNKEK